MKVLYDHTVFFMQRFGGISRYFAEIIKSLKKNKHFQPAVSDFIADNIYTCEVQKYADKKGIASAFVNKCYRPDVNILRKITRRYNDYLSIQYLKSGDFDIFHPTYYNAYFLPYLKGKPYILTVHDMVHEKFPEAFPKNHPISEIKKTLILNADRIIAISNNTKRDIVDILNIPPDKIDVIYHGSDFTERFDGESYPFYIPEIFLLYVGERKGYKNFTRFINAYAKLQLTRPDIKLVCTGYPFTPDEEELFDELNLKSSVFHCFPGNNKELSLLYCKAQLLVYPSLYEGFGIPILEAFSCNCPIVISNASCFPEIATNAAEYFDPLSEQSILDGIWNVINDPVNKEKLVENGNIRLKDFSWEKSAKQTFEVYSKVINLN
jgi:glycosyltransferase involved in cell wall biosynthesis